MNLKVPPKIALERITELLVVLRNLEQRVSEVCIPLIEEEKIKMKIVDEMKKEWKTCLKKIKSLLAEISKSPIFSIKIEHSLNDFSLNYVVSDRYENEASIIGKEISLVIDLLLQYYDEIKYFVKIPIFYISEQATICFYDAVCKLTPDTNEASLCAFTFSKPLGEWSEKYDIFSYMKGISDPGEFPGRWKNQVTNAVDGVNKKTQDQFGFTLFKMNKDQVSIKIASRFLGLW